MLITPQAEIVVKYQGHPAFDRAAFSQIQLITFLSDRVRMLLKSGDDACIRVRIIFASE